MTGLPATAPQDFLSFIHRHHCGTSASWQSWLCPLSRRLEPAQAGLHLLELQLSLQSCHLIQCLLNYHNLNVKPFCQWQQIFMSTGTMACRAGKDCWASNSGTLGWQQFILFYELTELKSRIVGCTQCSTWKTTHESASFNV